MCSLGQKNVKPSIARFFINVRPDIVDSSINAGQFLFTKAVYDDYLIHFIHR